MTPRRINETFGKNLRTLVDRKGTTVAQICREMEINRTQFNRYLSMESWPRPNVLARICEYFDVDARVVLEPLSEIEAPDEAEYLWAA